MFSNFSRNICAKKPLYVSAQFGKKQEAGWLQLLPTRGTRCLPGEDLLLLPAVVEEVERAEALRWEEAVVILGVTKHRASFAWLLGESSGGRGVAAPESHWSLWGWGLPLAHQNGSHPAWSMSAAHLHASGEMGDCSE